MLQLPKGRFKIKKEIEKTKWFYIETILTKDKLISCNNFILSLHQHRKSHANTKWKKNKLT